MNAEEWRSVVGYEGKYEVSSSGRIKSLPRQISRELRSGALYHYMIPGCFIKLRKDRDGYVVCELSPEPNRTKKVHQLVAEAFIGPRPPGQEVRHKNDRRDDNRPINLEYGTHAENIQDSFTRGNMARGSDGRLVGRVVYEQTR